MDLCEIQTSAHYVCCVMRMYMYGKSSGLEPISVEVKLGSSRGESKQ
jgi:hypothetical protein